MRDRQERAFRAARFVVFVGAVATLTAVTGSTYPRQTQPALPAGPSQPSPGTVQGRVLWNELPVSGATVYATSEYNFNSTRYGSARTDAQGRFSISGVPDGQKFLYVFGNRPEFWTTAVTPFTMVAGTGTVAKDSYLCKFFDLVSPRNDESVRSSRPILRWNPYTDAVDYAVRVLPRGQNVFRFSRGDRDPHPTVTSVQVDVDLGSGEYTWRVDAFNAAGHMIGCGYRTFKVTR